MEKYGERGAAERARLRKEKSDENKRLWAERTKPLKAKKMIGESPTDDKKRMLEFKEMLLKHTNGAMIISKIIKKALDDEDKDQAAMLKMCADRFIPVSLFEPTEGKAGGMGNITIVIGDAIPNQPKVINGTTIDNDEN